MDDSESDETRVLPKKTGKPSSFSGDAAHPTRLIRSITNRQRAARANSTVPFVQKMDTIDKFASTTRPTNYGYLEHIKSLKSSITPEDKSLPKKVR